MNYKKLASLNNEYAEDYSEDFKLIDEMNKLDSHLEYQLHSNQPQDDAEIERVLKLEEYFQNKEWMDYDGGGWEPDKMPPEVWKYVENSQGIYKKNL